MAFVSNEDNYTMSATVSQLQSTAGMDSGGASAVITEKDAIWKILTYVLSAASLPGNLLTIVVLCSSHELRSKPVNIFLIHQSVIDIISCCISMFEEVITGNASLVQPFICHVFMTKMASPMVFYASTYNMVFLSIERYLAIVNPMKYDADKVLRRLPFVFVFIWLLCIAVLLFVPVTTIIQDGICYTAYHMLSSSFLLEYYTPHCFVISFALPILIMIYCYARMYLVLQVSLKMSSHISKNLETVSENVSQSKRQPQSEKATTNASKSTSSSIHKSRLAQINIFQTCLLMATLTAVCWVTNVSALFLFMIDYYPNYSNTHANMGYLLMIVNALLNPYISILRYEAFKKQLKYLMS